MTEFHKEKIRQKRVKRLSKIIPKGGFTRNNQGYFNFASFAPASE